MARASNQKLKILYILDYLNHRSDEFHPVPMAELITMLDSHGISAERKSIYDDIEALRTYGADIEQLKGKNGGYYIASREFELPELKLLVDSVQSSKFITLKKTLSLIKKIEHLASDHEANSLQRQVFVHNRVKSMNESVYYNVDEISAAITDNRAISFKYFSYNVNKQKVLRRGGMAYNASPFALMWDNENYYLLAYDNDEKIMKHFRVDKMESISILDEKRTGSEEFQKTDMSAYSKRVFGMFGGNEQVVKLKVADYLVGAVIDRFGSEVMIIKSDETHFTVNLTVQISPQFFAWIFGFGTDMQIISPDSVIEQFKASALNVAALYEKTEEK